MTNLLSEPVPLPCGTVLTNRICKTAMSEGLADNANHATPRLETLYRRWARSGAGLLLSGNIQVDRNHLERPGNIVIDDDSGMRQLARLAQAGKAGGGHFWAQLSHTGRQVIQEINPAPLAPSVVELDVLRGAGFTFAPPREMTEEDIRHAIAQFAYAAGKTREAGFTGVSLHGAHGYLVSQFLSPLTNRRRDEWGGSLRNRARFLLTLLAAVREAVGKDFPIGLKLNSSDFQRGGFTHQECLEVVAMLNDTSLDLLELSGGSLEQPMVIGVSLKDQGIDGRPAATVRREAYFVEFAASIRAVARMPVMVVGGFRTRSVMVDALRRGELDMIGLGRPMIADPNIARRLIAGETDIAPTPEKNLDFLHLLPWNNMQLKRMSDGLEPDLQLKGEAAAAWFAAWEKEYLCALMAHRQKR